jgi:hypothetical protein
MTQDISHTNNQTVRMYYITYNILIWYIRSLVSKVKLVTTICSSLDHKTLQIGKIAPGN